MSQFIEMFFKNTWKEKYLEDVVSEDCSLSYGIVQPGEGVEDGIPVVRPVDLVSDIVEPDCLKKTTVDIANSYKRTTLKGGELLLCVRGTTGLLSMASNRLNGGNVTRGIVPIWFKKDISKAFMFHQMKSDYVQTQIKENTYGTTLLQINIKDLRKIKVILPPEDLQLKFVTIAEQADKSEFDGRKSQFIEMFGTVESTKPLTDFIDVSFPGEWGQEDKDGSGVKVIRTTNFTNSGKLDLSDVVTRDIDYAKVEKKKLSKGDIILERSGGTNDNPVGRVVYFEEDGVYLFNNFTQLLRCKEGVNSLFLFYSLFNYYQMNKNVIRSMGNKTTGIQNLKMDRYWLIPIADVSIERQKEFESIYRQADKSESGGLKSGLNFAKLLIHR